MKKSHPTLTSDRLREVLSYDRLTGVFKWKAPTSSRIKAGSVAGSINTNGHRQIAIDGRLYIDRRLAWLYVHGHWPMTQIVSANGDKKDCRISNLRPMNNDILPGVEMTAEVLRSILKYSKKSGEFTWKIDRPGSARCGDTAGTDKDGSRRVIIGINGIYYTAGSLAWLYVTGEWPVNQISHFDGDSSNTKFANLRDAPHLISFKQRRPRCEKSSKYIGVHWRKDKSMWQAMIRLDGKTKHIGYFRKEKDAASAHKTFRKQVHEDQRNRGRFGCTSLAVELTSDTNLAATPDRSSRQPTSEDQK